MNSASRILVVDDDLANRLVLTRPLEKAGHQVLVAEDGFEAVEIAAQQRPDLILLDMLMPGRSGVEVCRILKSQEDTAGIPVIFVTASSDADQVIEAFAAGGCDYLTKPFRADEMVARVSTHLRLREAEGQLRERNKELEGLARELAIQSRTDSLTALANRRTWEEAAELEHARFSRGGNPYSLVMIDVDFFKAFNDSQGHQAGDECLRRIAESMTATCRNVDSVGRYGGEEFIVLAPDTPGASAVKLAERIRKAVWSLAIPHPASDAAGRVTVSAGVTTCCSDSLERTLKRADDALYIAKKAGRNMVYHDDGVRPEAGEVTERIGGAAPEASSTDYAGKSVCVLVVDDESTNRVLCRRSLERAGYQVSEAVDGQDALTAAQENPPDVIVLDVMMPNMDGLECARKLRGSPDTCDIPIIMLSALTDSKDVLQGLEAGADEYVAKPIRITELMLRVRSMARIYRERADLLRSYEVRAEHTRVLTRLVEFCRAVGSSRSVDQVLRHTIAAVTNVTHCRRASVMVPRDEDRQLRVAKSTGIDPELAETISVPIGEPIAGKVFSSGRHIQVNSEAELVACQCAYDARFFTSAPLISVPLGVAGHVVGVLNANERPGRRSFRPYETEYVELIAKVTATALHEIYNREAQIRASDSIMHALAQLAEHRDNDTGKHLDRVTRYCSILAEELQKNPDYRQRINDAFMHDLVRSVPLHDIGKVAVPDHILLHPGKLDAQQMEVMRTHASVGARTLRTLIERSPGVSFLEMAAEIAHYHHEWCDGSGYPLGLKGNAIPLAAQLTAIGDVYDALTTKRVYKDPVSHDKAVSIITEASGTQFAPAIVDAFLTRERDFAELARNLADHAPLETSAEPASVG
ncbi:MAG: response regulator [Phycisphaerales bacterium]|nr:MAG: response regulator [Phycisphaerales bacterium]